MTTITPSLFSGQDYQMLDASTPSGASATSGVGTGDISSLLSALDNTGTSSSSSAGDTVSLSSQAQSLLAQLEGGSSSTSNFMTGLGGTGNTAGISGLSTNGFLLSPAQQDTVSSILAKYKNAPDTQATWESIQADLKTAGLGPDQLAAQNEVLAFNTADTQILTNAIDGTSGTSSIGLPDVNTIMSSEQGNANSYMQQIFNQWQGISTTAAAPASNPQGSGTDVTA